MPGSGRNQPCPCGSARKTKHCCGQRRGPSEDQLARALTTKLLTYATGGAPERDDRSKLDAIVGRVRAKNYGFRSLIHEIVESELFRMK